MRLIDSILSSSHLSRATSLQITGTTVPNPLLDPYTANTYTTYVKEGLKGSGPVYSLIAIRANAFAEARFTWRDIDTKENIGRQGLEALYMPWPNGTTSNLLKKIEIDVSLAGNVYIRKLPGRVEVLRPDKIQIVSGMREDKSIDLLGYVYWPDGVNQGHRIALLPDEVAHHIDMPDPHHPSRGMSWLTPVAREVDADTYMTRHKSTFFTNAATPALKLKTEKTLNREQKKELMGQFEDRHQGFQNAYKTVLLDGGADLTVLGSDFRAMQFDKIQAAGETRLAAAAGVPPVVVGFLQGIQAATYSNYAQAMRRYGDLTMRTRWRDVAGDLQSIVDVPDNAELWYDDTDIAFLQQDALDEAEINAKKADTLASLIHGGFTPESAVDAVASGRFGNLEHTGLVSVQLQALRSPGEMPPEYPADLTVNERRALDGLGPIEGGDAIYMPATNIPAIEVA